MSEPGPQAASEEPPPNYDRLVAMLSLGQNVQWRQELLRHVVRVRPQRVLDIAAGTAGVSRALADATHAQIEHVDLSEPILERERKLVYDAGLDRRIRLQRAPADQLPFPAGSFDAITFTFLLRHVADPAQTINELGRVLRPGGVMAGLDFWIPSGAVRRMGWRLYARALMPGIDAFQRRWPLDRLYEIWREAGMVDVDDRVISAGALLMWGQKHHA